MALGGSRREGTRDRVTESCSRFSHRARPWCARCVSGTSHSPASGLSWCPSLCRCDAGVPQHRLETGRPACCGSGRILPIFLLQAFCHQLHLLLREDRTQVNAASLQVVLAQQRFRSADARQRTEPRKELPLGQCPKLTSWVPSLLERMVLTDVDTAVSPQHWSLTSLWLFPGWRRRTGPQKR